MGVMGMPLIHEELQNQLHIWRSERENELFLDCTRHSLLYDPEFLNAAPGRTGASTYSKSSIQPQWALGLAMASLSDPWGGFEALLGINSAMMSIRHRYKYVLPSALPQIANLRESIHCNLTMRLERHPAFPRELCPDAPRWFTEAAAVPREIDYIPLGSWLLARLTGLFGCEEKLLQLIGTSCLLATREEQGVICFDIFEDDTCTRAVGVGLLFFEEHWLTLRGRVPQELQELIIDDLIDLLACNAMSHLAPCALMVGGHLLGWNGEAFFGSRRKTSRFHA
jgi:hypothetical protein